MADDTTVHTNVDIPGHWDTKDMDVVIDGVKFVAEDKARAQIDALTDALGEERIRATENGRLAREFWERAEDAEATLKRIRAVIGEEDPGPETIKLETGAGEIIEFTPQDPGNERDDTPVDDAGDPILDPDTEAENRMKQFLADRAPTTDTPFEAPAYVYPVEPYKKPWYRRSWLAGAWIAITGLIVGSAATSYNSDAPTLVETQTVVAGQAPAPAQPEGLSLSWPGVEGATYDVVIFRGGSLIEEFSTGETTATVKLEPGSYQWVVYSVIGGVRQDGAIVNSVLDVS